MKVLNILFDDRLGGPQKRVFEVGAKLLSDNVQTKLCLPDRKSDIENIAFKYDIPIIRLDISKLPKLNKWFTVFPWLFFIYKDIYTFFKCFTNEDPDIVHINGAFFFAPAIAARIKKIPIVWHLNDTILPPVLACFSGKLVEILSNEIIVAAEAVAKHYKISKDYTVIYAPVDINKFALTNDSPALKNNNQFTIGIIANWNPIKGLEYFVKSLAIINANNKSIKGLMGGAILDGYRDYEKAIKKLIANSNLEEVIEHIGYVESVPGFFKSIDCFLLTSISEACPIVILEAMAAGVPVIATDVGGNRELIKPDTNQAAGLVVPAGDIEAISKAVQYVIDNKNEAKKLGLNGMKLVSEQFSLQYCVKKHLLVYSLYV